MPLYDVEINGQKYELEAPDEAALKDAIGKLQGGSQSPATDDTSGASDFEAKLREQAKAVSEGTRNNSIIEDAKRVPNVLDDTVRTLGRGVLGVGSYLDEADAAFNATLAPVVDPFLPDSYEKLPQDTWSGRYDKALEIQRDKDKTFDEANPKTSIGLKIGGGILSGGALLRAAPVAAPYVLGNMGRTTLGRVGASTVAGAGTGAVQGFGAGEGDIVERGKQSAREMVMGAILGPALMPVAAGVNAGIRNAKDTLTPKARDLLSGVSKDAMKYVDQQLANPAKVAALKAQLEKLGPDAMLADVSPEWLGVARGAATRPGMRDQIVNPLNERSSMANTRLRSDVTDSLGPDPIPSAIRGRLEAQRAEVSRQYAPAFAERTPFDFTPITGDLDRQIVTLRGDAQRQLQRVREMMNTHGRDEVTNDPAVAFQTRQAIDGLLTSEQNPKVINALTDARQMIDDALYRSVPRIKEIDAQFHELSRQMEALDQGRPILNNEASAVRPSELEQSLAEGADPHGMLIGPSAAALRAKEGTLGEIYRAIGTKANDTTALRNVVRGEGDWNRAKLGLLFGQEPADRALSAIDRETAFADTANRVTRGSDTAMAEGFGDRLKEVAKRPRVTMDATLTGMGVRAGTWAANKLLKEDAEQAAARYAEDLGNLSVAKGDHRDAIVKALLKRGDRIERVRDPKMQALVDALMQTTARSAYPSLPFVRE